LVVLVLALVLDSPLIFEDEDDDENERKGKVVILISRW